MPYSIMLDAGHGGRDPGAVYNGRQEKDDTLELVLAIGEILQNNGIDVEYTRTTDVYESPYQKALEANEAGVDYFISIHRNSFPTDNTVSGVESLIYDLSGIKYEMAQSINAQLETIGFRDLGVKARPNLVVLRRTNMPAVLVEVGFINSDIDNRLFDQNFDAIAQAIADGILDTLNSNANQGNTDVNVNSENVENMSSGSNSGNSGNMNRNYRVQVGAFRNQTYADNLLRELMEQDFPAFMQEEDGFYRVQVGGYPALDAATGMEQRIKRAGYPTVIVS